MGTPLRVLIVEDSEDDALQLTEQLKQAGYDPDYERVDTSAAMEAALAQRSWDLILSDWSLPRFSGLEALRLLRQSGKDVPFIIVDGPIGEEAAVAAMQAGAKDYIRRENLLRLGPVVDRELRDVRGRGSRRKAEEALLQSEERYRRIVETAYEGIWVVDAEARTTYVNARMASMLGYSVDEMLGHALFDFIATDGGRAQAERNWERIRSGVSERQELRLRCKDGPELWTIISASPVYNDRGEFDGALGMVSDIMQAKQAEAALQEAKALYECLVEESLAGVYMLGDGAVPRFIYVNPRAAAIFGYHRDELMGRPAVEVVAPSSRAFVEENIRKRLAGEAESLHYQPQGLRKDGQVIDLDVLGARTIYQGQPVILGTLVDITERRRAEEDTRRLQAALLELAKDPDLTTGSLESAFRQITETAARTLDCARVGIWLYEEQRAKLRNVELYDRRRDSHSAGAELTVADYPTYFRALEEGRAIAASDACHDPQTCELCASYLSPLGISSMLDAPIRLDGQMVGIVCHEHVGPARVWTPEEESFAGSLADMAALALKAEEHRRAEIRLRAVADNTPAMISLKDMQGRYQLANRQVGKLVHLSWEEIHGKTDHDLFPKEIADRYRENDRRVLETGLPTKAEELFLHDGEVHTYLTVRFPLRDDTGAPCAVGSIWTDITERKQAEEQLRKSRRLLAEAQAAAQLGSWEWDLATNVVSGSAELYRLFGIEPHEGKITIEAFRELLHPDDRARVEQSTAEVIRHGRSLSHDFRIVRPDGTVRVLHFEGEVLRDESGAAVRLVGIIQDVTEHRRAEEELELARRRLLEAEVEKKRFTREVLRAVTNGKLQLLDAAEIPIAGQVVADVSLTDVEDYRRLRHKVKEIAEAAGMAPENADNLVLAMGEAAANSLKHAVNGRATVFLDGDRVIVRVTDTGPGILPEQLPATVLQAGFSTRVSLGMGFTLMLELSDCIWLATGPEGTVVQVANWIHPEEHVEDPLAAVMARF